MSIIVHVGSLNNDATRVYHDKTALEAVASAMLYEARDKGLKLYNGPTKPFFRQPFESEIHYGVPIRESNSGIYIAPAYDHNNTGVLYGYVGFAVKENQVQPAALLRYDDITNDFTSIAETNMQRLLGLLQKLVSMPVTLDDIEIILKQIANEEFSKVVAQRCCTDVQYSSSADNIEKFKSKLVNRASTIKIQLADTNITYVFSIGRDDKIYEVYTFFEANCEFIPRLIHLETIKTKFINLKNVNAPMKSLTHSKLVDMGIVKSHEIQLVPVVSQLMQTNRVTAEEAISQIEEAIDINPFMLMTYTDTFSFPTKEAYEDALFEAFIYACEQTDCNLDLMEESLVVYEDLESKSRQVGHAIRKTIDKGKQAVHSAGKAVHTVSNPLVKMVQKFIDDYNKEIHEGAREIAITGSLFAKIRALFKRCLVSTTFAFVLFGPLGALVSFTYQLYQHNKDNTKARTSVLNELDFELKMVREKIEDAKSAGDNEKKYQLMRLGNKIEHNIDQIKLDITRSKL